MSKINRWLKSSFMNYFWLGIVLVLLAIVLDKYFPGRPIIGAVAIDFIQAIGISILVAAIFTYVSSTNEFIEKITELLRNIVIDRNFLGNIDIESKRSALAALIKPTESEKVLHADIARYYDTYINYTLNITNKSVRSDYTAEARVFKDHDKSCIKTEFNLSYRLHPTLDGYLDIRSRADEQSLGSVTKWVRVTSPDGKRLYNQKPPVIEETFRGNKTGYTIVPLKELGKNYGHLKIEVEIVEFGHDHWAHVTFQALEPTDSFRFRLCCFDGIRVVSHNLFIHGAEMYVDKPSEKEVLFSCDQWINEGTGLAIVVSDTQVDPAPVEPVVAPDGRFQC